MLIALEMRRAGQELIGSMNKHVDDMTESLLQFRNQMTFIYQ